MCHKKKSTVWMVLVMCVIHCYLYLIMLLNKTIRYWSYIKRKAMLMCHIKSTVMLVLVLVL